MMRIKFYGVRGSIPATSYKNNARIDIAKGVDHSVLRAHTEQFGHSFSIEEFGGNTTCIGVLNSENQMHIIDTGSGARNLNRDLIGMRKENKIHPRTYVLYTHMHHDHTMGMPFLSELNYTNFYETYICSMSPEILFEGTKSEIARSSQFLKHLSDFENGVAQRVIPTNQEQLKFPVPASPRFQYKPIQNTSKEILSQYQKNTRIEIHPKPISHANLDKSDITLSYKIIDMETKKTVTILTDFEPTFTDKDKEIIDWIKGSDMVYLDGQYELGSTENQFVKGWGHCCALYATELACKANIDRILIGHHSPNHDDRYLKGLEQRVIQQAQKGGKLAKLVRENEVYLI